jgi:hypothetical protein
MSIGEDKKNCKMSYGIAMQCDRNVQMILREKMWREVKNDLPITNTVDDVFDESITKVEQVAIIWFKKAGN